MEFFEAYVLGPHISCLINANLIVNCVMILDKDIETIFSVEYVKTNNISPVKVTSITEACNKIYY